MAKKCYILYKFTPRRTKTEMFTSRRKASKEGHRWIQSMIRRKKTAKMKVRKSLFC